MELTNEFQSIRDWAKEKGIYKKGDIKTQYIKLQEEAGELAKAIINEDLDEIIDAIGDCVVVLTSIAELTNKHFNLEPEHWVSIIGDDNGKRRLEPSKQINIEHCINISYNVIAKRRNYFA